jgi:hypothetical protein
MHSKHQSFEARENGYLSWLLGCFYQQDFTIVNKTQKYKLQKGKVLSNLSGDKNFSITSAKFLPIRLFC